MLHTWYHAIIIFMGLAGVTYHHGGEHFHLIWMLMLIADVWRNFVDPFWIPIYAVFGILLDLIPCSSLHIILSVEFDTDYELAYLFVYYLLKWKFMYNQTFLFLEEYVSLIAFYQFGYHSPLVAIINPMAYYLLKDQTVVGILLFLLWSCYCPEYQRVIISVCKMYEKLTSHPVNCELWDLTFYIVKDLVSKTTSVPSIVGALKNPHNFRGLIGNEGRGVLSILSIIKEKPDHEYVIWAPKTLQKLLCAVFVHKCLPSKVTKWLPAALTTVNVTAWSHDSVNPHVRNEEDSDNESHYSSDLDNESHYSSDSDNKSHYSLRFF